MTQTAMVAHVCVLHYMMAIWSQRERHGVSRGCPHITNCPLIHHRSAQKLGGPQNTDNWMIMWTRRIENVVFKDAHNDLTSPILCYEEWGKQPICPKSCIQSGHMNTPMDSDLKSRNATSSQCCVHYSKPNLTNHTAQFMWHLLWAGVGLWGQKGQSSAHGGVWGWAQRGLKAWPWAKAATSAVHTDRVHCEPRILTPGPPSFSPCFMKGRTPVTVKKGQKQDLNPVFV